MRFRSVSGEIQWSEREFNIIMRRASAAGKSLKDWITDRLLGELADGVDDGVAEISESTAISVSELSPPIIVPEPAPELAPLPLPAPKRREPKEYSFDGPKGVEAIVDLVERYKAAREQTIAASRGASAGATYNRAISIWYNENGIGKDVSSPNIRLNIGKLHRVIDDVKAWAATVKLSPDITIGELVYAFETRKNDGRQQQRPATEPKLRKAPQEEQPEPEIEIVETVENMATPAQAIGPPALQWNVEKRKFEHRPLGEIAAVAANNFMEEAPEPPTNAEDVGDFATVALENLDNVQARTLRRFTERLFNQTLHPTEFMSQDALAAIIRKIKAPNERGDTPETARVLIRLGVIKGGSGCYKLIPDYIARLEEVQNWAVAAKFGAVTS